ncbi:hypothetical protein AWB72_04658 [Caballeronia concitans]|uniref:Antitoxin Xre/MbcA/ParS-like toxin-binding domain-containing protein n=2 Tax=Caballeronia concitans TaxID=1777133 RepID=A0A658R3D4_9BURK|nr:hypothetical protein AWB72_04658 [Caballeronia concitans]
MMDVLVLSTITEQAISVLGSVQAAQDWLAAPAIALDGRRPLDMLYDPSGMRAVMTLLLRMDFCVYA